jgi:hypothetical protein
MTGRHPIGDRVRRRPVITIGGLGRSVMKAGYSNAAVQAETSRCSLLLRFTYCGKLAFKLADTCAHGLCVGEGDVERTAAIHGVAVQVARAGRRPHVICASFFT